MRPVHVIDVAQALANLMHTRQMPGTFSLPGPSTYTMGYLLELVQSAAYLPPSKFPSLPKPIALAIAKIAQLPWFPMISPDEIERRFIDDSDVPGDWDAFGVRPDPVENHVLTYVKRFRSAYVTLVPYPDCLLLILWNTGTTSPDRSSFPRSQRYTSGASSC